MLPAGLPATGADDLAPMPPHLARAEDAPFDEGTANMPKLEAQARQGLELAEANTVGNPPHPPELVWEFPRGVPRSVKITRVGNRL